MRTAGTSFARLEHDPIRYRALLFSTHICCVRWCRQAAGEVFRCRGRTKKRQGPTGHKSVGLLADFVEIALAVLMAFGSLMGSRDTFAFYQWLFFPCRYSNHHLQTHCCSRAFFDTQRRIMTFFDVFLSREITNDCRVGCRGRETYVRTCCTCTFHSTALQRYP